jgi:tripartite-type tricarboxylate transporter receptor subunit TctC
MKRTMTVALAAAAMAFGSAAALAQTAGGSAATYPSQLVRIIVPFSAGSATDLLARIVAEGLPERWKQQVIVENRPGAPGTGSAARATPDGYTLMLTANGHTVAPIFNKDLPYDAIKDFSGVTQVASVPLVLIINPGLPAKTLKEFIELAKSKPGQMNYSSPGVGSTTFIAGALFAQKAGANIVHVPYKGAPEAVASVVRGEAQMYFTPANVGASLIASGQVRALAVTTEQRLPQLPDVPTFKEAGLPDFSYDTWFGILAPAATPPAILEKASADIAAVMKSPLVQERLAKQGIVAVTNTPAEFNKILREDATRYADLFKGIAKK